MTGDRKKNIGGSDKEVTSISFIGYTDQALVTSGDSKVRLVKEDGNEVRSQIYASCQAGSGVRIQQLNDVR